MNSREKVLAACVVGVLALGGLWVVVQWGVIARWKNLNNNIKAAVRQEKDLHHRIEKARSAEQRWAAFTPIAHNPDRAQDAFREDITQLLEKHGLGAECTIRPLPQRKLKMGVAPTGGARIDPPTEVRLTVQTRGTLRQLMDFLCEAYRRNYLAKLEQISVAAEMQGTGTRTPTRSTRGPGRRIEAGGTSDVAGPDGPKLNLSMAVTALVLPEMKEVPQGIFSGDVDPKAQGRLPRESSEYQLVSRHNLFKEAGPEPIAVATPPTTTQHVPVINEPTTTVEPPRPNKTLVGVTSTLGKLEAYVRDMTQRQEAPEKIDLNGAIDDGQLVLVVPRGVVVQVPRETGSETEYKYYFYKLGDPFSQRQVLDPSVYPDIHQELEQSLVRTGGPDER
jgi:hypothetical protein